MWWAGVLAAGDGAVLSHASAGAAWDIRRTAGAQVHVSVLDRRRVRLPGLTAHRPRRVGPDELTRCGGLPITTPARTVLDLAATGLRGRPLEAALDRAEFLRLLDFTGLDGLVARQPRRSGSPALRALLARYEVGSAITRSEFEERFLALCDRAGLPRPGVNAVVEGRETDFRWPDHRLVAEVDGYAYHRSPSAFVADRERDVALVLAGWRVLRFTWEQVTRRPTRVIAALRRALGVT
jgi:hypothetical protein